MISPDVDGKNNVLHIKLDWEGCFNAVVKYNGVPVSQGQFTVISLNCELFVSFLSFFLSYNKASATQNNVNQNDQIPLNLTSRLWSQLPFDADPQN